MITVYHKQGHLIVCTVLAQGEAIPPGALWIDMQAPSHGEEILVERQLAIQIPSKEEVWKNQVLNRLYQEDGVAYLNAAIITKVDSPYPQTSAVTFILAPDYLLTMRYITPTSFQNFTARIQRSPQKFSSSAAVLEGLLEEIITRVAHNSEVVVESLDQLSHKIFDAQSHSHATSTRSASALMKEVLTRLGCCADLNSKINESLHSLSRMLSFFRQMHVCGDDLESQTRMLMTDIDALIRQTAFLSDKITFQLDASLGMINIEQNLIIKIFSVVAVFFLPPTLISSMYGMNFQDMPELQWKYGYPLAVALMVLCAMAPYLFFRKKGWL